MKTSFDKADLILRVLTLFTIVAGGIWAIYQYEISGATDWAANITLEASVLPYHDDLRLLVVHVKTRNPRNYEFTLNSKYKDSFVLRFTNMPTNAKPGDVIDEDQGELIKSVDLMRKTGGEYVFLPSAEMDDMRTIVIPANVTVLLTAEMRIHNGAKAEQGKPGTDFISTSSVVHVQP